MNQDFEEEDHFLSILQYKITVKHKGKVIIL